jgi:hypothetical protein
MSIRKLGTKRDDRDGAEYVVVQVVFEGGTVEDIEYCETSEEAEATAARLNEEEGHGEGYVHGYMTVEAFDALAEADEDDDCCDL